MEEGYEDGKKEELEGEGKDQKGYVGKRRMRKHGN